MSRFASLTREQKHDILVDAICYCLTTYDPSRGSRFTSSLYRIAYFMCRDAARKLERRAAHEVLSPAAVRRATNRSDPSALTLETVEMLHRVPRRDRSLVARRAIENLSFRDLAKRYRCGETTIRRRYAKAIIRLRGVLMGSEAPSPRPEQNDGCSEGN